LLFFPVLGLAAYAMALLTHYGLVGTRARMHPNARALVFLLMAEIVWFWVFLQWEVLRVALGFASGLGRGFALPLIIVGGTAIAVAIVAVVTRNLKE